jgi:hypothetical protein
VGSTDVEWMIRLKEGLQSGRGWVGGIVLAGGRWDMLEGDGGGSLTWGIRPSSMRGRTRSDRRGGAHPRPPPRVWDGPLLMFFSAWMGGYGPGKVGSPQKERFRLMKK